MDLYKIFAYQKFLKILFLAIKQHVSISTYQDYTNQDKVIYVKSVFT
jgi:hypothetical protein